MPPLNERKIPTLIVASSMNVSIFLTSINLFRSLLKPSHNIESVLSSLIFFSTSQQFIQSRLGIQCHPFSGHASRHESHVAGQTQR